MPISSERPRAPDAEKTRLARVKLRRRSATDRERTTEPPAKEPLPPSAGLYSVVLGRTRRRRITTG